MELIKFITAGNVDDGKSTLIGRLLYDSHAISNDILENVQQYNGEINFSYLTDGLKAEREQGITIDVAYKYFSTDKRKFIIADCPGHKEYTRNMITGASHSDIAIILVDATNGITEQTKRHSFLADLMNIPCIVFCINKMDAVGYSESIFREITEKLSDIPFVNPHQIEYVPVSALKGDNVVHRSENMKWYDGSTLLHILENYQHEKIIAPDIPAFMQVQYVAFQNDERFFFGTLLNGEISINDEIVIYPTQQKNKVKSIYYLNAETEKVQKNTPVALTLKEETDVQRGYYFMFQKNDLHLHLENNRLLTREFSAICVWFDNQSFLPHKRYYIQQHASRTYLKCKSVSEILDIDSLVFKPFNGNNITMNTIFKSQFITAEDIVVSNYTNCPELGSFIIVDENSFKTVGAGIVVKD